MAGRGPGRGGAEKARRQLYSSTSLRSSSSSSAGVSCCASAGWHARSVQKGAETDSAALLLTGGLADSVAHRAGGAALAPDRPRGSPPAGLVLLAGTPLRRMEEISTEINEGNNMALSWSGDYEARI